MTEKTLLYVSTQGYDSRALEQAAKDAGMRFQHVTTLAEATFTQENLGLIVTDARMTVGSTNSGFPASLMRGSQDQYEGIRLASNLKNHGIPVVVIANANDQYSQPKDITMVEKIDADALELIRSKISISTTSGTTPLAEKRGEAAGQSTKPDPTSR